MPVAEDDGVGGVAHRQHHCKGDAHGDRDQGVERVNVQRFGLEEERIHRNSVDVRSLLPVFNITNVLLTTAGCWLTLAGRLVLGTDKALPSRASALARPDAPVLPTPMEAWARSYSSEGCFIFISKEVLFKFYSLAEKFFLQTQIS